MPKHESKSCPRCNQTFECKVGDIAHCQCNSVQLSEQTLDFLSKVDFDCLCKDCLAEINAFIGNAQNYQFPSEKDVLVEGLHYYKEGGNWVFTELYHYLRGSCCSNGCRHCVYGNAPKKEKNHVS